MKTLFAVLALCLATAAIAAPRPNARALETSTPATEFVVAQFQSTQTLVCKSWFYHVDYNQYGGVTGTGCTATGPLVVQGPASQGHVNVDFTLLDGTHYLIAGCMADTTDWPGYTEHGVNCVE